MISATPTENGPAASASTSPFGSMIRLGPPTVFDETT